MKKAYRNIEDVWKSPWAQLSARSGQEAPVTDRILRSTRLEDSIYADLREDDTTIEEVEADARKKLSTFPALSRDIFQAFYSLMLRRNEEAKLSETAKKLNSRILDRVMEGEDYPTIKNICEGRELPAYEEYSDLLAAFKAAGESMVAPEKYSINNITGTLNIMNAAVKHNCKIMIFSSSAATFGEPQYLPMDENHPQKPINYYGFTKLKIEEFMDWYDQLKGMRFAALRYFNAAGYDPEGEIRGLEQNPANLLPRVMEVAAGMQDKIKVFGTDYDTRDGTCIRDYVHVTDLARAHVMALDYITKNDKSLTVNLGTEKGTTVKEIIDAARRITGKAIPSQDVERRPGDPACLYATSKRAKELLGWEPKYSDVDTLVKTTWEVYK